MKGESSGEPNADRNASSGMEFRKQRKAKRLGLGPGSSLPTSNGPILQRSVVNAGWPSTTGGKFQFRLLVDSLDIREVGLLHLDDCLAGNRQNEELSGDRDRLAVGSGVGQRLGHINQD